jgi:hypothetical protein
MFIDSHEATIMYYFPWFETPETEREKYAKKKTEEKESIHKTK